MSASMAAAQLLRRRGVDEPVEMAVLLGTGLGALAGALEGPVTVSYQDLPGFPGTTVPGHAGQLAIGVQEGVRVAYLQGAAHYYENGDSGVMASALETLALLGAWIVLLTSTAGSVRPGLYPGNIAMITDHINISGINPLVGTSEDARFVNLVDAYDPRLRQRLKKASVGAGVSLQEAVYMWFPGPSFETPAEVKLARQLGADVLGMSMVPEVIIARRLGLRVAALSIVTNFGAGFSGGNPSHEETERAALAGTIGLKRLIRNFLKTKVDAWRTEAKPEQAN
jgi:purine-nucleoside phosphorylase